MFLRRKQGHSGFRRGFNKVLGRNDRFNRFPRFTQTETQRVVLKPREFNGILLRVCVHSRVPPQDEDTFT